MPKSTTRTDAGKQTVDKRRATAPPNPSSPKKILPIPATKTRATLHTAYLQIANDIRNVLCCHQGCEHGQPPEQHTRYVSPLLRPLIRLMHRGSPPVHPA